MNSKCILRTGVGVALWACLALSGGCSSSGHIAGVVAGGQNFVISLSGFKDDIGKTFYLKVTNTDTGTLVAWSTPVIIETDGFYFYYPDIILSGGHYNVDMWVDADNNGLLDHSPNGTPAGVDESWRVTGTGADDGLKLTFVRNTEWTDVTPFWPNNGA
jgi:hypothetical protein